MGWLFNTKKQTKKEFVSELLKSLAWGGKIVLAHKSTRQGLYAVVQDENNTKILVCIMISKSEGCYGSKDLSECVGPSMNDCPTKFFELVGEAPNEFAESFRERCRARESNKNYVPVNGDIVNIYGKQYKVYDKVNKVSYEVQSLETGGFFKSPRNKMTLVSDKTVD